MLWNRKKTFRYKCSCCGEEFTGAPSFGSDIPIFVNDIPEDEREGRILVGSDLCRIRTHVNEDSDDDLFTIRVNLEIPIHGSAEPFLWGLWVTQSKESFFQYLETYDQDQSKDILFGWLPITMSYYRDRNPEEFSGSLACDVHWGPQGQRPTITLHESEHPLYRDQVNGIDWDRAVAVAQECMRLVHDGQGDPALS